MEKYNCLNGCGTTCNNGCHNCNGYDGNSFKLENGDMLQYYLCYKANCRMNDNCENIPVGDFYFVGPDIKIECNCVDMVDIENIPNGVPYTETVRYSKGTMTSKCSCSSTENCRVYLHVVEIDDSTAIIVITVYDDDNNLMYTMNEKFTGILIKKRDISCERDDTGNRSNDFFIS